MVQDLAGQGLYIDTVINPESVFLIMVQDLAGQGLYINTVINPESVF